jgi:hypothetical protein
MDEAMNVGLQEELLADLTEELKNEPTFNAEVLTQKVINAIKEVRIARKYPRSYTDEQIETDLYDYYSNIRNLALYDYNKVGAEFEEAHNENSVNRNWVKRNSLFYGVMPLARL